MLNDFVLEDEEFEIERIEEEKTHILWEDTHTHSTKYMQVWQHWIRKLKSKKQQKHQRERE